MHAKVIIGGICATGKNLDFSSFLMRKLRSSVAKYLLGESRGSWGVYSPKEMGGLGCRSGVIIWAQDKHGTDRPAVTLILLPLQSRKLSYSPCLARRHGPTLGPASAHAVLRGSQSLWDFFILFFFSEPLLLHQRSCISHCVCENCFSSMPSAAVLFSFSCWLEVWFHSREKIKTPEMPLCESHLSSSSG